MTNWTETHWTRILSYDLFTGEDTEGSGTTECDESNGSPQAAVRRPAAPDSSTQ